MLLLACLLLAACIAGAAAALRAELRRNREEATLAALVSLFAPAAAEARDDPRRLLAWQPAVSIARRLFGPAMARLDAAAGGTYPFGIEEAREAHARWTAAWLSWERAHDEEYKMKAGAAEARGGPDVRAAVAAIERDKLERYQQRYEEYVRVGKALAALCDARPGPNAGRTDLVTIEDRQTRP